MSYGRSLFLPALLAALAAATGCESAEPADEPGAIVVGSIDFHGNTEVAVELEAAVVRDGRILVYGGWDMALPPPEHRLLVEPQEVEAGTPWTLPTTRVDGVGTYFRVQVVIESDDGSVRTYRKQWRKSDGDFGGRIPLHSRKARPGVS